MLDYKKIRQDFPILNSLMNGKPLVFLDSAASSQKPLKVIEAFEDSIDVEMRIFIEVLID